MPGTQKSPTPCISLCQVLEDEYSAIHGKELPPVPEGTSDEERLRAIYARIHQLDEKRTALCISGGGIRSATFALGVIQGLARCGVLDKFHYLSTVSGGGYIGSWLTAWMHRHGMANVIDALSSDPRSPTRPEPTPVWRLREYSNYLNPKLGALSADTWTLIATVVRNLLLNWTVLLPLLAAALMIPRFGIPIIKYKVSDQTANLVLIAGCLLMVWAIAYIGAQRPSAQQGPATTKEAAERGNQASYIKFCLFPMTFGSVLLITYWAWRGSKVDWGTVVEALPGSNSINIFIALGILVSLLPFFSAAAVALFNRKSSKPADNVSQAAQTRSRTLRAIWEFITRILVGALAGVLVWCVAMVLFREPNQSDTMVLLFVCFASPALLTALLLAECVFVGLSSYLTSDHDREWWSRSGAWILIYIVVWSGASSLLIFGPMAILDLGVKLKAAAASVGGLSGLITIILGRSSKTAPQQSGAEGKPSSEKKSTLSDLALKAAVPIFAITLVLLIALGTDIIYQKTLMPLATESSSGTNTETRASTPREPATDETEDATKERAGQAEKNKPPRHDIPHSAADYQANLIKTNLETFTIYVLGLLLIGGLSGIFININKFSLHAMYRNRLIRAYLGASREKRRPNLFTGFDDDDNIQMRELWPNKPPDQEPPARQLFHLVNMTLNLVAGDNLAWQQRKAESFTSSPLHSGSYHENVGYRRTEYTVNGDKIRYGGKDGISLGTAVAISGAAASPNMGYHSSPIIGFLLTLFNARLGWWLGNPSPAGEKTFMLPGPTLAALPLIEEALGLTNDKNDHIYLSDGGHFENLALYEMVLRRCHVIVVSDAGQDGEFKFEDLGGAVRKIRIDFGVPIEFLKPIAIYSRSSAKPGYFCALAKIRYSCVDGPGTDGVLVYIKPTFYGTGNEPADVYQYAQTHPEFPHDPTSDQWFDESQFESYRTLGSYIISLICGGHSDKPASDTATPGQPKPRGDETIKEFVENVMSYLEFETEDKKRVAVDCAIMR